MKAGGFPTVKRSTGNGGRPRPTRHEAVRYQSACHAPLHGSDSQLTGVLEPSNPYVRARRAPWSSPRCASPERGAEFPQWTAHHTPGTATPV